MATAHEHRVFAHHAGSIHDQAHPPISPTLTNPDLILPDEPRYNAISATSPTYNSDVNSGSSYGGSPHSRQGHRRNDSDVSISELGVATAVVMPTRLSVGPPATINKPSHSSTYHGYEHGAPLSDIGEEETEIEDNDQEDSERGSTPKGTDRSPSPEEVDEILAEVENLGAPPLRHKKRLSDMSSTSDGSDRAEWEKFDTTKLVSGRVAADIAQARTAADNEDAMSRRSSKDAEDDLNERAEKILESARKRLSHMEDNLTKARHSIVLSTSKSSPNMHELGLGQQPGGGLYRSISQNAQNRRSRFGIPVKPNTVLSHGRAGSDNVVASGINRLSRTPELRSVSALDYGRPWLGVTTPEKLQTSHSPSSSRSYSSPLRILAEEAESPSTVKTSPDTNSSTTPTYTQQRGLGIHSAATKAQEDLTSTGRYEQNSTPTSFERSSSQASTRSAKELKDQMAEMKSRIAELRHKAQADTLRRRSIQSLRTSSPFNNSNGDLNGSSPWRPSSPATYERAGTSLGHATGSGEGWRSISQQSHHHQRKDSALDNDVPLPQVLSTPPVNRLLSISTPPGVSSARTDRNTPNLARGNTSVEDDEGIDFESQVVPSNYDDEGPGFREDEEEDEVWANEEEQIYLNEVLEESLHEPEVPAIPTAFLGQTGVGEERHEDRLDAFDYENMFLHSAMGTYTGEDDSDDQSDSSSVQTSRRKISTPTGDKDRVEEFDSGNESDENNQNEIEEADEEEIIEDDEDEVDTDEEMEAAMSSKESSLHSPSPTSHRHSTVDKVDEHSTTDLEVPSKPWMHMARNNSYDSISSTATFETATEGGRGVDEEDDSATEHEDDTPDEILNWGNNTNIQTNASPREQTLPSSPLGAEVQVNGHRRYDSGSGMEPAFNSQAHVNGDLRSSSGTLRETVVPLAIAHSALASSAATNNNNASSSNHHRTRSTATVVENTEDQMTPQATTFAQRGISFSEAQEPAAQNSHDLSDSTVIPGIAQNAARGLSPVMSSQAPRVQPIDPRPRSNQSSARPSPSHSVHPANTEILMESLIKLADPTFTINPSTRFAELDKELVLNLLRALGGVCNGILHAEKQGEVLIVKDLRGRLRDGEEVLIHGLGVDDEDEDDDERMREEQETNIEDDYEDDDERSGTVRGLGIDVNH